MPLEALTSAEISLPPKPDALRVRERIAALADSVDLVALTDNHAGEARMRRSRPLHSRANRASGLLFTFPAATATALPCNHRW